MAPQSTDIITKANHEGYLASLGGERWGDNPYPKALRGQRDDWFRGWLDGLAERHKDDPIEPEPEYFS